MGSSKIKIDGFYSSDEIDLVKDLFGRNNSRVKTLGAKTLRNWVNKDIRNSNEKYLAKEKEIFSALVSLIEGKADKKILQTISAEKNAKKKKMMYLQLVLKLIGCDPSLAVDGKFGTNTFKALLKFQNNSENYKKIEGSPDAIAGGLTLSALINDLKNDIVYSGEISEQEDNNSNIYDMINNGIISEDDFKHLVADSQVEISEDEKIMDFPLNRKILLDGKQIGNKISFDKNTKSISIDMSNPLKTIITQNSDEKGVSTSKQYEIINTLINNEDYKVLNDKYGFELRSANYWFPRLDDPRRNFDLIEIIGDRKNTLSVAGPEEYYLLHDLVDTMKLRQENGIDYVDFFKKDGSILYSWEFKQKNPK